MLLRPQAGLQSLSVLAGMQNRNSTVSETPPAAICASLPGTSVWRGAYILSFLFRFLCGIYLCNSW